jgi:hypothetical protein
MAIYMTMKLLCVATCAKLVACVGDAKFKLIVTNTGIAGGASIYWTGMKEGKGFELPDNPRIETFMSFVEVGESLGSNNKYGSRFLIRGGDSKGGPGFRAQIQIQKGDMGFPYAIIVEAMDKAVEIAYRGESGTSSHMVEPGESARLLAHGFDENSIQLGTAQGGPSKFKVALYDADDRQLRGAPSRSLQNQTACAISFGKPLSVHEAGGKRFGLRN